MDIRDSLINQELFDAISPISIAVIIKILIVTALLVYTTFAFILIKQVGIKRETVETPLGPKLTIIAIVHFLVSTALTIGAIVAL